MSIERDLPILDITPEVFLKDFTEKVNSVNSISHEIRQEVLGVIRKKTKNKGINFQSLVRNQKKFDLFTSQNAEFSIKKLREFDRGLEHFLRRAGLLKSSEHLTLFASNPSLVVKKERHFSNDELISLINNSEIFSTISKEAETIKREIILRDYISLDSRKKIVELIDARSGSYKNFKTLLSARSLFDEFLSYWIENFPDRPWSINTMARSEIQKFNKLGHYFRRAGLSTEDDIRAFTLSPHKVDQLSFKENSTLEKSYIKSQQLFDEFLEYWDENFAGKNWNLYTLRTTPQFSVLDNYFRKNGLVTFNKLLRFCSKNKALLKKNPPQINPEVHRSYLNRLVNKQAATRNRGLLITFLKSLDDKTRIFNIAEVRRFSVGLDGYLYREGLYSKDALKTFLGKRYEKLLDTTKFETRYYTDQKIKRIMGDFFTHLRVNQRVVWTPKMLERFNREGKNLALAYVFRQEEDSDLYWIVFLVKICELFGDSVIREFRFKHRKQGFISDNKRSSMPVMTRKKDRTKDFFGRETLADEDLNPEEALIVAEQEAFRSDILGKLFGLDKDLVGKILNGEIDIDTKDPQISALIEKGQKLIRAA